MENHIVALFENIEFIHTTILGLPAWYWLSMMLAFLISFIIVMLINRPCCSLIGLGLKRKGKANKLFIDRIKGPVGFLIFIATFWLQMLFVKSPKTAPDISYVVLKISILFTITFILYAFINLGFSTLIDREAESMKRVSLILPLGRRISKIALIALAVLLFFSQLGVDISAFLVGLGVGGLAIALAAQRLLERFFGGAILTLDQPFFVGDVIKCGDLVGTIEEIGLCSTRIRTTDRTIIIIPNSSLANMNIENYSRREKIRLVFVWRLDLKTPMEKIRQVISSFEKALSKDENFENNSLRVCLKAVGDLGYEVEVLAFFKTNDFSQFTKARENLFLNFMNIIKEQEIKLATPSQISYLSQQ